MKKPEKRSLENNRIKQKPRQGVVFQIMVDNYYYYGQVLTHGVCGFFDWRSSCPIQDISLLLTLPVLFRICVYPNAFSEGKWAIVGKIPIRDGLLPLPFEYIYHEFGTPEFELYNPNNGEIRQATKEECRDLECCSVWAYNHVEDRLIDHYANRPCIWLKERDTLFL